MAAVFGFRFLPGFRALISFPAGLAGMRVAGFVIVTFLGHLIWDSVLVYIGYAFVGQWLVIIGLIDKYLYITALIVVIVIITYVVVRLRFK